MNALRILIADDEQPARKKIRVCLKEEGYTGTIIEAKNGLEALQLIQEGKPGIIFLDIQMPGLTGFEVIEAVGIENMPVVVFVTAYDQYAIDAFEVQAVDYLLKPYDQERFRKSFQRALGQVKSAIPNAAVLGSLLAHVGKEQKYLQRIMVSKGTHYFLLSLKEITYISAEEKYVKLHTSTGTFLIRDTMNHLEQRLDPTQFSRIHRSHIVNIDFIQKIEPWSHGDCRLILKNGIELIVSRRYRDRLFGRF